MNSLFSSTKDPQRANGFKTEALKYVGTLPFATREEYLVWVKEWRNDYRAVSTYLRSVKLLARQTGNNRPEKAKYLEEQLAKLDHEDTQRGAYVTDAQLLKARAEYKDLTRLWDRPYRHAATYMLLIRAASKLQAAQQRALRKQPVA